MVHALKTEMGYFEDILTGDKTFEVRKFDRPFQVKDDIILQEWDVNNKTYSGNEWHGKITYILDNERFCKKGFCILGIKPKQIEPPKEQ